MKHIKQFEGLFNNYYWIVKTRKPYLEISLEKIGYDRENLNDYLDETIKDIRILRRKLDWVIATNLNKGEMYITLLESGYIKVWSYTHIVDRSDIFRGRIEVTQEDIKDWKIKNIANKYNI
jgi:hypothetical protein